MPPTPTEKPNKIRLRVYGWATLYARIDFLQMGLAGEPVWMFVSQQFGEVWIRQSRIIDLWIQVGVKRRDRYVPILERRTDV